MNTARKPAGILGRIECRTACWVEGDDSRVPEIASRCALDRPPIQVRNPGHETMTVPAPSQPSELLGDHPANRLACLLLDTKEPLIDSSHGCIRRWRGASGGIRRFRRDPTSTYGQRIHEPVPDCKVGDEVPEARASTLRSRRSRAQRSCSTRWSVSMLLHSRVQAHSELQGF